jgi:hypothetical protein
MVEPNAVPKKKKRIMTKLNVGDGNSKPSEDNSSNNIA